MEYNQITQNILNNSSLIAQCHATISQMKASGAPSTELFHTSRYLALEKLENMDNEIASDNFKEIFTELSTYHNLDTTETTIDTDNSVLCLKISGILDSVLENVSKREQLIYIYRYFFFYSLEDICNICYYSLNNLTKTLSSINESLKKELHKENLTYTTMTLLHSFADIDNTYLDKAIKYLFKELNLDIIKKDTNSKNSSTKKLVNDSKKRWRSHSFKKFLNLSFAVLLVVLVIANLYLVTDGFKSIPTDKNEEYANNNSPYNDLFIYRNGQKTVDINALLNYKLSENYTNGAVSYKSEHFIGVYSSISLKGTAPLADCIGEEIPEMQNANNYYYKLKGIDSVQYVINKSNDTYRLYELFDISLKNGGTETSIDTSYHEILSTFYGISSDEDIKCITVSNAFPFKGFDDDYVKKLIDDNNDISQILYIISNSKYNNQPNNTEPTNSSNFSSDYLLNSSVKLAIEKKDGTIVSNIFYKPNYHYFYKEQNFSFSVVDENDESLGKYLDNMLDFTQHNREPIDPTNWNLDIQVDNLSHVDLSLSISQKENPIYGLYIGQDFIFEKYEDGTWVELPIHSTYDKNNSPKLFLHIPCNTGISGFSFPISKKYSNIPDIGKYRLTFTVYDSFSKDLNNPTGRNYTVELEKTS